MQIQERIGLLAQLGEYMKSSNEGWMHTKQKAFAENNWFMPDFVEYEGGVEWSVADGTSVKGQYILVDGTPVDAGQRNAPIAVDTYYIVPSKCTECQGFHEEPQCAAVCPVDCCVPDEMYQETVEELLGKKERLHL